MDWITPKSPLKNGLFVRRPLSNALLRFLSAISRRRKSASEIPLNPKKILLCNIANFGDVVISTCVLPAIKKKYPNCEIGFVTSSPSAVVLKNHPMVAKIHTLDHWYLNRQIGKCKAALHYRNSKRRLLQELHDAKYDVAIDLYPYFPNAIPILTKSLIPVRIGYTTGGFRGLLTHAVEWTFYDRYVGYAHLNLLKVLGIEMGGESPLPSYGFKRVLRDHIVVHMGSSHALKEWEVEKWIGLIQRLEASGEKVVLTGKGDREGALCRRVAEVTSAKDLSNKLNWAEFVAEIQEARLLISVDSVAVHIAAGALTPTVGLFSGINSPFMWMPPYAKYKGVMDRVACAPCFNNNGCSRMTCIKEIGVEEIYMNAIGMMKK